MAKSLRVKITIIYIPFTILYFIDHVESDKFNYNL